ncbi:MAG: branched-chain amino acid ABC transporter permease [Actinomycetia bacterium]|nr:branched-chain amino acid ABC transporter permease [Actinomycetes bacterium]MCP5033195.1 branched-chain amino acid ABC transporter permease [Actinomycetes bacterium]
MTAVEEAASLQERVDDAVRTAEGSTRRSRVTGWVNIIVVVLLLILPFLVDAIALRRMASIIVLTLAVLGVVVATGYGGLISLGHGAFVGLGAFAMGAYLDLVHLPLVVALVATFVTCWIVGWLFGLPALRVKGIYLALLTLGLGVVFPSLAKRFPKITGGVTGRPIDSTLEAPAWLGDDYTIVWRYFFCLAVCVLMFWLTGNVLRSRMGRAMQAVRDDETSAATFGIDLVTTKAGAFGLSAALAGTSGALQAVLFPFVSHEQFNVFLSFRLYAAAVIGGVGYLAGAVYGVIALIIVPVINDALGVLENDVFVFGAGLVLLTFVSPDGIAGLIRRWERR